MTSTAAGKEGIEMREILFRAKCIDGTCLKGKWVEGDLSRCVVVGETHIRRIEENLSTATHRVDPSTVCQYTGLTDKNGRKIFEGDVVVEDEHSLKAIVRFGEYECNNDSKHIGFYLDWGIRIYYRKDLPFWADKVEIIGSVFDGTET